MTPFNLSLAIHNPRAALWRLHFVYLFIIPKISEREGYSISEFTTRDSRSMSQKQSALQRCMSECKKKSELKSEQVEQFHCAVACLFWAITHTS
jgi:hypothetical protein